MKTKTDRKIINGEKIKIINEKPNATKNGLRMVIDSIHVENNKIIRLFCRYSDYHRSGGFYVDLERQGLDIPYLIERKEGCYEHLP